MPRRESLRLRSTNTAETQHTIRRPHPAREDDAVQWQVPSAAQSRMFRFPCDRVARILRGAEMHKLRSQYHVCIPRYDKIQRSVGILKDCIYTAAQESGLKELRSSLPYRRIEQKSSQLQLLSLRGFPSPLLLSKYLASVTEKEDSFCI